MIINFILGLLDDILSINRYQITTNLKNYLYPN